MSALRDLMTVENTKPYLEMLTGENRSHVDPMYSGVGDAIAAYLVELAVRGDLSLLPNVRGFKLHFAKEWNALVSSGPGEDIPGFAGRTRHNHAMGLVSDLLPAAKTGLLTRIEEHAHASPFLTEEDALAAIIEEVECGDFTIPDVGKCDHIGLHYGVEIKGWAPRAYDTEDWLPTEDIKPSFERGVEHLLVDFPTGELLILKEAEFPELNKMIANSILEYGTDDTSFMFARSSLAKRGIVYGLTGDADRLIVTETGVLNFSKPDSISDPRFEDADRISGVGAFTTVIDRQTLETIIRDARGCDEHEAWRRVENVIRAENCLIHQRSVEPGMHHFLHGSLPEAQLNEHDIEGAPNHGMYQAMVISPRPLEVKPKPCSPIAIQLAEEAKHEEEQASAPGM